MQVMNVNDRKDSRSPLTPTGASLWRSKKYIRWLSQAGPGGAPEYGFGCSP